MSYPPQGYPPPNAYPPPPGNPPQYGHPQGYPQQQAYPQHGYGPQQYPPPPPGYQSSQYPPRYPPQQMPNPKPKRLFRILLTLVLLGGATFYGVMAFNADRPKLGDCLASMDGDFFGGMEVVDCSDPSAAFEVVEYSTSGTASNARASICDGHPDGESHVATRKRGRLSWAICAVPLSASDESSDVKNE